MNIVPAVTVGYLLDGVLGDPRWVPHPVRGIGHLITVGERWLNRSSNGFRLVAGGILTATVVLLSGGVAWGLVRFAGALHPLLADAVTALGTAVLLARRSLAEEAGENVYRPLAVGDLPTARRAVSRVVGRNTEHLDESEVARAAVETLAENASDGVVAPLLFALAGGLPALAAYKAINTLDSMIGHRDERYLYFGRVAARLDDLANWVPARITMLGLVVAASWYGLSVQTWRVALADGAGHASPNAGWPEAAMAGALGVRLGGLNFYEGEPHHSPIMNAGGRAVQPKDIPRAVLFMQTACHLVLFAGISMWIVVRVA